MLFLGVQRACHLPGRGRDPPTRGRQQEAQHRGRRRLTGCPSFQVPQRLITFPTVLGIRIRMILGHLDPLVRDPYLSLFS
jgi:hypothetical protein